MIKKTIYIGSPAYLSLAKRQLVIKTLEAEDMDDPAEGKEKAAATRPIEDIAFLVLDNRRITITSNAIAALTENNCSIISCDSRGMPIVLTMPLAANTVQNERFRDQLKATLPLQKQLWQQVIQQKIINQAAALNICQPKTEAGCMRRWAVDVKSGDSGNVEGKAAAFYWRRFFVGHTEEAFVRDREGFPPNNLLNYGYAILRSVMARALVSSGLLPTLGIHHHNRYNAYCLADDIMEPYRPFVDVLVFNMVAAGNVALDLTRNMKAQLLSIPTLDVRINGRKSPLMIAASITTASLARCFAGETRRISVPEM